MLNVPPPFPPLLLLHSDSASAKRSSRRAQNLALYECLLCCCHLADTLASSLRRFTVPHPSNFSNPQYMQSIPATVAQSPIPQSPSPQSIVSLSQSQPQAMATVTSSNPVFSTPPRPSQTSNHQAQAQQQQQHQHQHQQLQQQTHSPVSALSPQQAAREKARVAVLLDINSALLQEVVNLQASGKAGVTPAQPAAQQSSSVKESSTISPTSPTDISGSQSQNPGSSADGPKPPSGPTNKPSIEYIDCMRRLQANLAYLATVADRAKKSGAAAPQAPAIMTPPPSLPGVTDLYTKLSELFPGASKSGGVPPSTPQQQQHHQQRNLTGSYMSPQGNGTPVRNSPAETMV